MKFSLSYQSDKVTGEVLCDMSTMSKLLETADKIMCKNNFNSLKKWPRNLLNGTNLFWKLILK